MLLVDEIEKISSIQWHEFVEIKATLHALDNRQFICGECKMKYMGKGYKEDQQLKYQESKGCFKLSHRVLHRIKDLSFKKCIGNYFSYQAVSLLEAFESYEKGIMPYPGSYMDQPHKIIDAFRIISAYRTEKLIAQQEEQVRQSRMNRHGR